MVNDLPIRAAAAAADAGPGAAAPGGVRRARAMTLIELLIVIAIIVVLAGLSLAAWPALRRASEIAKTREILTVLGSVIRQSGAERANNLSSVEHPLAGSAAPRARFVRGGTELDRDGEALRVGDIAWINGAHARVLLPEDRFADTMLPLLYGEPRWRLRVLGATCELVTRYRELPEPPVGMTTLTAPYNSDRYPDERHLVAPRIALWEHQGFKRVEPDQKGPDWDEAVAKALDAQFAGGIARLGALGALVRSDPERDAAIAGLSHRVREDRAPGVVTSRDRWSPGRVRAGDAWLRYRLRGPAIYDAWGVEVLVCQLPNGGLRLASAGRDGVFRWHPGSNGELDTDAASDAPAGDDRDGAEDNVVVGDGAQP